MLNENLPKNLPENDPDNTPEAPSADEVQEALDIAVDCQEKVANFLEVAVGIDQAYINANEHRHLSLDDLPYGEEILRATPLPDALGKAVEVLTRLQENPLPPKDAAEAFSRANDIVSDAKSTLNDLPDLKLEETDDSDSDGDGDGAPHV